MGGTINTLTSACQNCDISTLYQRALFFIIAFNPMSFDPQVGTPGCSSIWRAIAGACAASWIGYVEYPSHADTITIFRPCSGSPCCLQNFRVCRFLRAGFPDSVVVTPTGGVSPTTDCKEALLPPYNPQDTLPPPPPGTMCEPICDWLQNILETSTGKLSSNPEFGQMQKNFDVGNWECAHLAPNPATNEARIRLIAPETGAITIRVVNISGLEVSRKNQLSSVGENTLIIDTSTMPSGVYMYEIQFDNTHLFGGKLVVER